MDNCVTSVVACVVNSENQFSGRCLQHHVIFCGGGCINLCYPAVVQLWLKIAFRECACDWKSNNRMRQFILYKYKVLVLVV